jgi:hypothetical protein
VPAPPGNPAGGPATSRRGHRAGARGISAGALPTGARFRRRRPCRMERPPASNWRRSHAVVRTATLSRASRERFSGHPDFLGAPTRAANLADGVRRIARAPEGSGAIRNFTTIIAIHLTRSQGGGASTREGTVAKTKYNRTPEAEMRIGALLVARGKPNGFATTTQTKEEIHHFVNLTPEDHATSITRNPEPMYYQIVGNVVSHEGSSLSIFRKGYAIRNEESDGFTITHDGLNYLTNLGL